MKISPTTGSELLLWAGSDASLAQYQAAVLKFAGKTPAEMGIVLDTPASDDINKPKSRLLTIEDGVGFIQIAGSLVNSDSWWNKYAGLISYNEVMAAFAEAEASSAVQEIFPIFDTPGGMVAGAIDAVEFVAAVTKRKRVTGYSNGMVMSAGYWLASPIDNLYLAPTADAGSIGVVMRHVEYSKMNEADGITVTVLRAGDYKQLMNSVEPLTAEARAEAQKSLDETYKVFMSSVAGFKGLSYAAADRKMGQGREFTGQAAVDAGLARAVATYDEVIKGVHARISKKGGSGMDLEQMRAELDAANAKLAERDAKILELTASVSKQTELEAKVTELTQELETVKASTAPMDKLLLIATDALNGMQVAMGGSALEAGVPAALIIEKFDELKPKYVAAFKPGGVSGVEGGEQQSTKVVPMSRLERARLKAVKTK